MKNAFSKFNLAAAEGKNLMAELRIDQDEPERLKKRLAREKQARLQAEEITEKVTRELYEKQQELVLLKTVAAEANQAGTIDEAMRMALSQICQYTGWPVGHVYM